MLEQYHKLPVGTLFIFKYSDDDLIDKLELKKEKKELDTTKSFVEQIAQFKDILKNPYSQKEEWVWVKILNPGFTINEKINLNKFTTYSEYFYKKENELYIPTRKHKLSYKNKKVIFDILIPFQYVKVIDPNGIIKTT